MKKKFYFEDEDSENAHSEEFFKDQMKSEGITEMKVLEAVPTTYETSDFVYCKESQECVEKIDCRKNCDCYSPTDTEKCISEGIYCEFGEEVILKL